MTIASPVKLKTATPIPLVAPRMARIAEIQQVAIPKAEEGPVRRVVLAAFHRQQRRQIVDRRHIQGWHVMHPQGRCVPVRCPVIDLDG